MKEGKPDSFDDLESVTMIFSPESGWNLFASGTECGTLTFPSLFPDPMEAIINLAGVLALNAGGPTQPMSKQTEAEIIREATARIPSRVKEARHQRPARPQSPARPKR